MSNSSKPIIAILPLGAHEQHGPHLSHETDAIIAEYLADKLTASQGDYALKSLKTQTIGYSPEHQDFAGTISLHYDEAIETWLSIIKTQYDLGVRRVLLLNAHGGNSPLLTIVATEARVRWGMLVVATHWARFGLPERYEDELNKPIDIHAGDIETSIMLAIAPDCVDMNKAEDFSSCQREYSEKFKYLRAYGPHAFGWKMQDLNPKGAVGRANAATAQKGHAILEHALLGLSCLLEDMAKFDIGVLR